MSALDVAAHPGLGISIRGERKGAARLEAEGRLCTNEEELMRKLTIALLAGAGALCVGSASASDIYTSSEYTNSDLLQPVRLVCDDSGRCYRTRGGRRVIGRECYHYMR